MGQDCKYCGAYVAGSADKCPACGKRINYKAESGKAYAYAEPEVEKKAEAGARAKTEQKAYTYKDEYEKRYGADAAPAAKSKTSYTPASDKDDVKENQLISFLCYFGPLFLIPYLVKPNSEFVKFHSNQGLLLLIASIAFEVVGGVMPFVGWIISLLGGIFVFACFLKGLINVYHGVKAELPIIGGFRLLK